MMIYFNFYVDKYDELLAKEKSKLSDEWNNEGKIVELN